MRSPLTQGSVNVESVPFALLDAAGNPVAGAPNDFAISYRRSDQSTYTSIATVPATPGTPVINGLASEGDGGFELGIGTDHKASGTWLRIKWGGTGIRPDSVLIQLLPVDLFNAGSAGLTNLDAAVSTRSSHAAPDLGNLDAAVSSRSSHGAPDLSAIATTAQVDAARDAVVTRGDIAWVTGSSGGSSVWTTTQRDEVMGELDALIGRVDVTANDVADAVLSRGVGNVEDTADRHSLGAVVMLSTNAARSGTGLVANKPSDNSVFATYTIASSDVDPLTSIA